MDRKPTRVGREVYPRPEHRFSNAKIGMTHHDSEADFPVPVEAPDGAPNVVVVLLDDVGYGWPSVCGGLVRMPAAERLARDGLTYCQFHTTALCAPTRAALLTGRNHHSVSTGVVQEMATGFPGYAGLLPRSCATVGQILSMNGYATGWWGKNHNTPDSHTSPAGPFTHWPTRLGFDYFYGFMGGETDQFYPGLFRNLNPVSAPASPTDGYHLTTDLADDCIAWMRTQKALAPERPFFVHFAPGAAHGPHQPPLAWRGRNAGRFDLGWDRYRDQVLARQLEMGVVAPGTRLTGRPPEIAAWESLGDDARRLFRRQVENFADFLEHTDHEIGRLVQALADLHQLENTLFMYILGDNGSSAEGSLTGTISELAAMQGIATPLEASLRRIDEIGLPGTSPHFAVGWAWAGDAPFQWVKQVASHFGGTRNGMIVSWPAWIADVGAKRFQFHHVIDVVPTILDVVGIAEPVLVDGVAQKPIEGVSMAYTFDRAGAAAASTRRTQYFEMLGNRALYHEGWIASCRHGRLPWVTTGTADFARDRWELYNIEEDFSQSDDLAARHPEKLRELQDRFLIEAGRHDVLPLDDRFAERLDATLRPSLFGGRRDVVLFRGMGRLPEGSAPGPPTSITPSTSPSRSRGTAPKGCWSAWAATAPVGPSSSRATGSAITTTGSRSSATTWSRLRRSRVAGCRWGWCSSARRRGRPAGRRWCACFTTAAWSARGASTGRCRGGSASKAWTWARTPCRPSIPGTARGSRFGSPVGSSAWRFTSASGPSARPRSWSRSTCTTTEVAVRRPRGRRPRRQVTFSRSARRSAFGSCRLSGFSSRSAMRVVAERIAPSANSRYAAAMPMLTVTQRLTAVASP